MTPIPNKNNKILCHELQELLDKHRATKNFSPIEWVEKKCHSLNAYLAKHSLRACVVNVSGGIDSAVTLSLCQKASTLPLSPIQRIVAVCQPIHSSEESLTRGIENSRSVETTIIIPQTDIFDLLTNRIDTALGVKGNAFSHGQMRSYLRTPVAYYTAQVLSQEGTPAIVVGTGNGDEDGYLGYFCKAGDGVVDVHILSDLHKSEVKSVAIALGVPQATVTALPSADLWPGQSDEEEMGFSYDFVELYTAMYLPPHDLISPIGHNTKNNNNNKDDHQHDDSVIILNDGTILQTDEAKVQFKELAKLVDAMHKRNAHKLRPIPHL